MPALRTLGSAVLSVIIVGLGVSLGRRGRSETSRRGIRQTFFSDKGVLSDEQRRLLVACGAVLEWERRTEFSLGR